MTRTQICYLRITVAFLFATDFINAQGQQSGFPGPLSFQQQQQQQQPQMQTGVGGQQQGSFLPGGGNGQLMQGQPQGGQFSQGQPQGGQFPASGQFNQQMQPNGLQQQQGQPMSNQFVMGQSSGMPQQQTNQQFTNPGLQQGSAGQLPFLQQQQQSNNLSPFPQQPPLGSQIPQQPFVGNQPTQIAGAPQVRITTDLNAVDKALQVDQATWQQPQSLPLYCVSQSPAQELRFLCSTCNNTASDQALASMTQQFSDYVGYPAIKLNPMPISGEMWDRQRLACVAYYQGPASERLNVTTYALLNVVYMGKPQIFDQTGHKPLLEMDGRSRFYVPQNSALTLVCFAKGNPPPSSYQWRAANQIVSASQQIQVTPQLAGNTLSCRATNAQAAQQGQSMAAPNTWESSDEVLIDVLVGPVITENNFDTTAVKGIKDTSTGKVALGKTVTLQCSAGSSSRPFVLWKQQTAPGRIGNASCEGGPRIVSETKTPSGPIVRSECNLRFDGYEKSGEYWCSACSFIADNNTLCNVALNSVPPTNVPFELTGPPVISPYYRTEYVPNSDRLSVYFTYCADPPLSTNDIYFTLDKERLNMNNRLSGGAVQAGMPQQNQTYSRCYDIPLAFDSASTAAKYRTVQLTANYGTGQTVQQSYNIYEAANNPGRNETWLATPPPYNATALIVGLSVGLLLLIIIILTAFCWYKQKACFAPKKPTTKTTKIGGGKGGKYQSSLAASQLRPDVSQEKSTPLTRPNTNGFNPERSAGGNHRTNTGYSPPDRRAHEGMTYSEFDLVKDSARLAGPSGGGPSRPVEYARMQPLPAPPSGGSGANHVVVKSPTNSVV